MNRVNIKIYEDDHYALKHLYRLKIDVYNITHTENGNIYTIDIKDLEKLDPNSIEVVSYKGFKKLLLSIKRKRHFLISVIISIIMMFILNNFIVKVDVIHSDKDIRILVEDELYDRGLKPFTFKKTYKELQEIKKDLKNAYKDDIEWLEIIDDGMKYTVRVEERIITKKEEEPTYCDVISTKNAIIMNSVVDKGQMLVGATDYVKKDDVIISGQIKFNGTVKNHVCASGEVYGNTWYRVSLSVPYAHEEKTYTGKKKGNIGLEFGSKYTRIFKIHFDSYDIIKRPLISLGRFAIYKESVLENNIKEVNYTEKEALDKALELGREKLKLKLDDKATILSEKVLQTSSYDSIINVEIFYSVKEIIGKKVEREIIVEENGERE